MAANYLRSDITINVFKLPSSKGFIDEHTKLVGCGYTGRDAFDKLNDLYFEKFGVLRYSDYESFRMSKSYHQNK